MGANRCLVLIACVGLLLTALALPRPAYADGVTPTFTGPSTIILTEDGSSPSFLYILSNPASGTTLTALFPASALLSTSGDTTDTTQPAFLRGGLPIAACGSSLAPGASCGLGIEFFQQTAKIDANSGTQVWQFGFVWSGGQATENVTVTVCDPGVAVCTAPTVPEPSSVLLLGSGLFAVGLFWLGGRAKRAVRQVRM